LEELPTELEAGQYALRDAVISFERDASGKIVDYALDFRGDAPNPYDLLKPDWVARAYEAAGGTGDVSAFRDGLLKRVEQLAVNKQALQEMMDESKGDYAEADFLREQVERVEHALEKKYGDILK
jgi:hypothetical protein